MSDVSTELVTAYEGPPSVLWRHVIRRAQCGLVMAGAEANADASLCFGWVLPRADFNGETVEDPTVDLLRQLVSQDKRILQFRAVSKTQLQ